MMILIVGIQITLSAMAQSANYQVTGKILNQEHEPLIGSTVQLTHSKQKTFIKGSTTDTQGNFTLTVPQGNYLLTISYVGYTNYTTYVEVKGNVNLPLIILNEDSKLMNEVVITARTVTYNTNGCAAYEGNHSHFAGRKTKCCILTFLSHQLCAVTSGTNQLTTLTGI